jgi:glycosyltransferase involved in cell wall biosynthesis
MKALQILPELNSGGVERGTFEVARHLVQNGHEAIVVSNGGRMVPSLQACGIKHIAMPVHKKRLSSLFQIAPFRRLLAELKPDILHIRSRLPAWVAWLAWRKLDPQNRPRLVSTVHGFYSVNSYSAVMTRGERIIAISESIRDYILKNYPRIPPDRVRVIHRGVSPEEFPRNYQPDQNWLDVWRRQLPQLENKALLLLPARLSRWKGQQAFVKLVAALKARGLNIHGLLAGEVHPRKRGFLVELQTLAKRLDVEREVTFLGHRNDLRELMSISDIVFSLSSDPEAFGRISLEAMSLGRAVIGFNHGGVAEQLARFFPAGAVPVSDFVALTETTIAMLRTRQVPLLICPPFTQAAMCSATLRVYQELLSPPC